MSQRGRANGAQKKGISDTEKRRGRTEEALRESEERLRIALDAARLGTFDFDLKTQVVQWDERTKEMCGIPGGENPRYDEAIRFVHPDDRANVEAALSRAFEPGSGGSYQAEFRIVRPDGSTFWNRAMGRVDFEGEGPNRRAIRQIGVNQDITEYKQAEQSLQEVDRQRTRFLAILSHELRNPLGAIQSSLSVLERVPPGGDQARRATEIIGRQSGQMTHMVDDLLDLSRLTSGKINLRMERLDLHDVLKQVVDDYRATIESSGVGLEVRLEERSIPVMADRIRLYQIFVNLIKNAVEATPSGGRISISSALDAAGERALAQVADTGVGIAPESMPLLFQPFARIGAKVRQDGALGLGLSLVKGLVELHAGTIDATSPGLGQGAVFTVRLPLSERVETETIERPAPPSAAAAGRRILLVEDNRDFADSLRDLLGILGHQLAVATTGTEALAQAQDNPPEILLCDIGLPGLSGYAVAKAFRADERLKDVYLVALTGYAQPEDQARAAEAGFDRHLAKPVELATLEQVLAEALSHGKTGPEA